MRAVVTQNSARISLGYFIPNKILKIDDILIILPFQQIHYIDYIDLFFFHYVVIKYFDCIEQILKHTNT